MATRLCLRVCIVYISAHAHTRNYCINPHKLHCVLYVLVSFFSFLRSFFLYCFVFFAVFRYSNYLMYVDRPSFFVHMLVPIVHIQALLRTQWRARASFGWRHFQQCMSTYMLPAMRTSWLTKLPILAQLFVEQNIHTLANTRQYEMCVPVPNEQTHICTHVIWSKIGSREHRKARTRQHYF